MSFLDFLKKAKAVKQSGWSLEQYIEAVNILLIEQHNRSFKFKKCMAIMVDLPRYSIDPIIDDKKVEDGGMVVGGSNPMMSVQRANKERPMGTKKAKRLDHNNTSKGTSEASRMLDALQK